MTYLPFTFSWVSSNQTTYNPSTMNGLDEAILDFEIDHQEGQVPTLTLKIKNPRIGLLNPGRNVWAWFAWNNNGTMVPLFFGVLVGVPTSLFLEVVTIKLIARSPNFIMNKQAVAETMKIRPYYDPIWFDTQHRDDPDSILEGWSALWHIDRTTMAITASDILNGEDGTVTFTADQALYNSVSMELGQPPLANVRVEASVNWTQRSSGFMTVPTVFLSSYTGETLLSDWPKAGASIGGGYKVESSFVTDVYFVANTPMMSYNSTWSNADPNPGQCSNASASSSSSGPALLSPNSLSCILTGEFISGVCFPDSDPPVNTPASTSITGVIVPMWSVALDMNVRYDARREFSEAIVFDMTAATQGILASPTVSQDTELITIASVDIGQPLESVLAWTDFANAPVAVSQIIFPNNPTTPGGQSYQICIVAGIAGSVEPVFSDFIGQNTTDGTVVWASMGDSPLTNNPGWTAASFVPVGQIILLQNTVFNPADGDFEDVPNSTSYYMCVSSGETNSTYTTFTYTPPRASNEEATPAPRVISYLQSPAFVTTPGVTVADGSVIWKVLGTNPSTLTIPIGGTPTNVTARQYFPTNRGLWSIEFLICKARARLRFRSRAVKIGWQAPFALGVGLSCRMNATLYDPRLPGGVATGKIIGYKLTGNGDSGELRSHVEIGCAIGFGGSIAAITGTPVYASAGYVQAGYQQYAGAAYVPSNNDISYTPPTVNYFDDGLSFPLQWRDVSDGGLVSGSLAQQAAAITASFQAARILAYAQMWAGKTITVGQGSTTTTSGISATQAWTLEQQQLAMTTQNIPYVMEANPVSWSCLIKPCADNGPFEGGYTISVTPLVIPEGINLLAPSS